MANNGKRPLTTSGDGSGVSKMAKALFASPSSLLSSVILKQESEGQVAQGGRASQRPIGVIIAEQANPPTELPRINVSLQPPIGVIVAQQANPPMELPRINVSLHPQLLHCAVAGCNRPLEPPVFKCVAGHRLCNNCRGDSGAAGHCRECGRNTTFVHCGPDLDVYIGGFTVACPFQSYGCNISAVAFHESGAYAPCRCALCPFKASPAALRDHLAADHAWRVHAVPAYGQLIQLRAAVPSEPPHRLLVVKGDERRVFVLSVRARGAGMWAVSLACVRASARAWPRYTYTLWAAGPPSPDMPADRSRWLGLETDVPSCAVPGAAVDDDGMALWVPPVMLIGRLKEIHLRLRIDVVDEP